MKENGYSIDSSDNGEEALAFIEMYEYDLIVLDILLPKLSGLEILEKIRGNNISTPVILLTALSSISDKVTGLDMGADDYLVKPFSFEELLARIRMLLRRGSENKTNILTVANLSLDTTKRFVTYDSKQIDFTAKEYAVLEYLMRNEGNILTRSQIAEHVWDYDFDFESNVVDVYIRYIRRKLEKHLDKKIIHTIRGVGYVLRDEQ